MDWFSIVLCKRLPGRVDPERSQWKWRSRFGLGTSVAGLHVDALEEVLQLVCIAAFQAAFQAFFEWIDPRDSARKLTRVYGNMFQDQGFKIYVYGMRCENSP